MEMEEVVVVVRIGARKGGEDFFSESAYQGLLIWCFLLLMHFLPQPASYSDVWEYVL
jgi:hypothetical protein